MGARSAVEKVAAAARRVAAEARAATRVVEKWARVVAAA